MCVSNYKKLNVQDNKNDLCTKELLPIIKKECELVLKFMKVNYEDFPNGACSMTSEVLAYIFKYKYCLKSVFILRGSLINDPESSHAWLFVNGIIVDLTLYQFNEKLNINAPEIFISESNETHNSIFYIFEFSLAPEINFKDNKYLIDYSKEQGLEVIEDSINIVVNNIELDKI